MPLEAPKSDSAVLVKQIGRIVAKGINTQVIAKLESLFASRNWSPEAREIIDFVRSKIDGDRSNILKFHGMADDNPWPEPKE